METDHQTEDNNGVTGLLPTGAKELALRTPLAVGGGLRARARISSAFRIPSARHLWLGLNREILNVAQATPAISLNRTTQICGTSGRAKPEDILARALTGAVGGAGAGTALGFAVAGPAGAAVGFMWGFYSGLGAGCAAGWKSARWLQDRS